MVVQVFVAQSEPVDALPQQVHLSVVTENESARRLYEALGFTIYGTEPRSLFVDGRYLDEHMMVLRFD